METALGSVIFVAAVLCAGTMGFAIQRGGTCTVAAVEELLTQRRAQRLVALLEASIWVAGGLVLAAATTLLRVEPPGYAASVSTVVGGSILGLGAYVNRACVFGTIARVGSGEWAYLVTPIGFFIGCLLAGRLPVVQPAASLNLMSPVLQAAVWVALMFVAFAVWRILRTLNVVRRAHASSAKLRRPNPLLWPPAGHVWSPHVATTVIGVTFIALLLLVGPWAYTDVLADAAHGMTGNLKARLALMVALLAGAVVGGLTAGQVRNEPVRIIGLLRCFAGGALMGWGSLVVPGGNDSLILVGMPLLWPYAWLAFGTMCVVIGLAIKTQLLLAAR